MVSLHTAVSEWQIKATIIIVLRGYFAIAMSTLIAWCISSRDILIF